MDGELERQKDRQASWIAGRQAFCTLLCYDVLGNRSKAELCGKHLSNVVALYLKMSQSVLRLFCK
jgi:hypothetical protein